MLSDYQYLNETQKDPEEGLQPTDRAISDQMAQAIRALLQNNTLSPQAKSDNLLSLVDNVQRHSNRYSRPWVMTPALQAALSEAQQWGQLSGAPIGSTQKPGTFEGGLTPAATPLAAPAPSTPAPAHLSSASLDAFQKAYQGAFGRQATQDELNNVGYLATLSNDLIQYLPETTLRQMALGRLAQFGNDFIAQHFPDIIPLFPNERLLGKAYNDPTYGAIQEGPGFGLDFLARYITDPNRRQQLGIQGAAAGAGAPNPTVPGTTPAPGTPSVPGAPPAGGNGPSAGPSQGPDISKTFPGYYAKNPNVEKQYAEWRDARRAAGQDPYDMAEFRKHLIALGAPDPGEPQNVSPYGPGTPGPGSPGSPGPPGASPAPGAAPATTIPPDHAWVTTAGAQDWAYALIAKGEKWENITPDRLSQDMAKFWEGMKADPSKSAIYSAAQEFYARSGRWPSQVQLNQFTQNMPNIPNILPDGTVIPKDASKLGPNSGDGNAAWRVPTGSDGKPVQLPPGYEWRFDAHGTPVQMKTGGQKDLFSGWYQDPKTGQWTYDPMAGAADYLQYNKQSQGQWGDLVNQFVAKTGRMPNLTEARNLASQFFQGADAQTKQRAAAFFDANGFNPTPWELENGPSQTAGGNAPQFGQVPMYVPGIGVVLTWGQQMAQGGQVLDPFKDLPGAVRPWIKEVLNGNLATADVPAEMRDWVNYGLSQFKDHIPKYKPQQTPWGVVTPPGVGQGSPGSGIPGGLPNQPGVPQPGSTADMPPGWTPLISNPELHKAATLDAWRQFMPPGTPPPTDAQLNDVGWLAQNITDTRILRHLDPTVFKQLPNGVLEKFSNEDLRDNLDPDSLGKLRNERLVQFDLGDLARHLRPSRIGQFAGDFINKFPNDVVARLPRGIQDSAITDKQRRIDLGLDAPQPATTQSTGQGAQSTTQSTTQGQPAQPKTMQPGTTIEPNQQTTKLNALPSPPDTGTTTGTPKPDTGTTEPSTPPPPVGSPTPQYGQYGSYGYAESALKPPPDLYAPIGGV